MLKTGYMWKGWCANKLLVILLWAAIPVQGLVAQSYFNRIYPKGDNEPNIIVSDTGFVVLQQNYPQAEQLDIRYFDLTGNPIKWDSIGLVDFYENCRNCLVEYEGGYLKAGTYWYPDETNEIVLIKFNAALDTLKTAKFSYANIKDSDAYGVKAFSKNEILVVGNHYVKSTGTFWMLLTRLDSNLNAVWEQVYKKPGWNQVGGYSGIDVEKTADGGYLIGGIATRFLNQPNQGLIIKTDSLGNAEWSKTLSGPEGNNEVLLMPRPDGEFDFLTIQSLYRTTAGNPYNTLRFGRIDDQGQISVDTLLGPQILNMSTAFFESTPDGQYITSGYAQSLGWKSYAMKFTEQADSIWFREYFYGNELGVDEGHIETMATTPDSGFIFCGYFMDKGPGGTGAHTWLIKTDKYGCDTAGCHTVSTREYSLPAVEVSVFPNPFEDELEIKWEGEEFVPFSLSLSDAQGKVLFKENIENDAGRSHQIRTAELAAGIYFLEIRKNHQLIAVKKLLK